MFTLLDKRHDFFPLFPLPRHLGQTLGHGFGGLDASHRPAHVNVDVVGIWGYVYIYIGYVWDMYGICMRYGWDMYGIWIGYVWDMYEICMGYVSDMYEIYMGYVSDMYGICKHIYIWDMYGIWMEYVRCLICSGYVWDVSVWNVQVCIYIYSIYTVYVCSAQIHLTKVSLLAVLSTEKCGSF